LCCKVYQKLGVVEYLKVGFCSCSRAEVARIKPIRKRVLTCLIFLQFLKFFSSVKFFSRGSGEFKLSPGLHDLINFVTRPLLKKMNSMVLDHSVTRCVNLLLELNYNFITKMRKENKKSRAI